MQLLAVVRRGRGEPRMVARWRGASTTWVLLAAVIYATVIAPAAPGHNWFQAGDDAWARTGTVLLHIVGPVVLVVDFLSRPPSHSSAGGEVALWVLGPFVYLSTMATLVAGNVAAMPYPFLDPDEVGWAGVVGAVSALLVLLVLLGGALIAAQRAVQVRRAGLRDRN